MKTLNIYLFPNNSSVFLDSLHSYLFQYRIRKTMPIIKMKFFKMNIPTSDLDMIILIKSISINTRLDYLYAKFIFDSHYKI